MARENPLLSIVTVVYNGREAITPTLESIRRHKTAAVEYVVVDGGSTDGTLDLLEQHKDIIDTLISEPDKGIYDAMNKAWKLATGVFILNINIGDELLRLPETELREAKNLNLDALSFPVILSNNSTFYPVAGAKLRINNTLHHQGTLYRRTLPERYNLQYRVFADFDLNQRLYKQGKIIKVYPKAISKHDTGGISHSRKYFNEVYDIIGSNFGSMYKFFAFLNFKLLGLKGWIRRK